MKKWVMAAVVAAGLCVSSAGSARVVRFDIFGGSADFSKGFTQYDALGQITTTGDTGVFSLGNGLVNFSLKGVQDAFETQGEFRSLNSPFAVGLGDLSDLSITLDHGRTIALTFNTGQVAVPFFNDGERVDGEDTLDFHADLPPGFFQGFDPDPSVGLNTTINSAVFGPADATLTLAGVPEPTTWAMMIAGFAFVGAALRRRSACRLLAAA